MLNSIGPSLESWGTPADIDLRSEMLSFILTENCLLSKNELMMLNKEDGVFIDFNLYKRPSCQTLSNAFDMSINTAPVWRCFSYAMLMCSVILRSYWTVE
jgi:hypothetical protein